MSDIDQVQGKLDIGRVFGDGFGAVRRQIVPLVVFMLVLSIPSLLNAWLTPGAMFPGQTRLPPTYWLMLLIGIPLALYSYAFQFHLVVSDLVGEQASWRRSLRAAVGKLLPLLGLLFLWTLAVWLGLVLFLVPGLILLTMWSVCVPVIVGEPVGPIRAFGRSRALTKGNRWRIFGLLVLLFILLLVFDFGILALMRPFMTSGGGGPAALLGVLAVALVGVLFGLLIIGVLAALYAQLRSLKEGLGGASAASVFD